MFAIVMDCTDKIFDRSSIIVIVTTLVLKLSIYRYQSMKLFAIIDKSINFRGVYLPKVFAVHLLNQ